MPFIWSLLLFAAPFALIGAIIGYLIRHGQTPPVAFLGSGIPLIALGIAGLASVGIIIYPIGVILFWIGIGKSARWARESPADGHGR